MYTEICLLKAIIQTHQLNSLKSSSSSPYSFSSQSLYFKLSFQMLSWIQKWLSEAQKDGDQIEKSWQFTGQEHRKQLLAYISKIWNIFPVLATNPQINNVRKEDLFYFFKSIGQTIWNFINIMFKFNTDNGWSVFISPTAHFLVHVSF